MHDRFEPEAGWERRVDEAIAAGIRRGRLAAAAGRRKRRIRRVSLAGVCLLAAACLLSIRVSPAFASMLREIPGLEKFVDWIGNSDPGIRLAVKNKFVQPLEAVDAHDGRAFAVQGVLADEMRMVVFYELRSDGADAALKLSNPRLTDDRGADVKGMYVYFEDDQPRREHGRSVVRGTLDVWLQDGASWPDEVNLSIETAPVGSPAASGSAGDLPVPADRLSGENGLPDENGEGGGPTYRVRFPIDKTKFAAEKKEYAIGRTVVADGQKIVFDRAVVTPLRIALYLDIPAGNAKQVFGAGDIRLVDEQGGQWAYRGGWGETDHPVLYFDSNYFRRPKELYVEGSWFRALDKTKLDVVVDTEKKRLIRAPDDKLKLAAVDRTEDEVKLGFRLEGIARDDRMGYTLLLNRTFTDASGTEYEMADVPNGTAASFSAADPSAQSVRYVLDNKAYRQPLTFRISDYPAYIRQPYRLRIY